jgi:hypothetical protein
VEKGYNPFRTHNASMVMIKFPTVVDHKRRIQMGFLRNLFGKKQPENSEQGVSLAKEEKYTEGRVYSFIASTIMLDSSSALGKSMLQQVPPYVYQNLKGSDSTFRELYDKVEKKNSPHIMGTGMARSIDDYPNAFLAWLKSKGVIINNIAPLMKKKIFVFSGDAKNPQNNKSYNWCMFIYFDIGE